jgi:hypothetical protein
MPSYSGLFDGVHGEAHSLLTNKTGNDLTMLARLFKGSKRQRDARAAVMTALLGASVGETASASVKQVDHTVDPVSPVNGGLRTINTVELVNRATTSADLTAIEGALELSSQPTTYATDLSGNGGGGKLANG